MVNWSRCRFGCGLGWVKDTTIRWRSRSPDGKGQFWGGKRYPHGHWLAERAQSVILLQLYLSFEETPDQKHLELQETMLKSDKIWCTYLMTDCVSLWTFWTLLDNYTKMPICSPKWIQNGTAVWSRTSDRIIHDWRKIWSVFERCIQTTEWDNHACCLQSTWWPHIPAESNTIPVLILLYKFLICRHSALSCKHKNKWKQNIMTLLDCIARSTYVDAV